MKSYYEILRVHKDATPEEIKKAYRKQAMLNHPDVGGSKERFQEIGEAYDVLKSKSKREQYDKHGHQGYKDMRHESSDKDETWEDFLRRSYDEIFGTRTEVDSFVSGFPRHFRYNGDNPFVSPSGDIPWTPEEVKIMKLETALGTFEEQLEILEDKNENIDEDEIMVLFPTEKLLRLALALKSEHFLSGRRSFESIIDLIQKRDEKVEQYFSELRERERALDRLDIQTDIENNDLKKSERNSELIKTMKGNHRLNKLVSMDLKTNGDVAEEKASIKERDWRVHHDLNWKDTDSRKKWRKEKGDIGKLSK